jgi:hypothetical protein
MPIGTRSEMEERGSWMAGVKLHLGHLLRFAALDDATMFYNSSKPL